jgi:hypothetical protein
LKAASIPSGTTQLRRRNGHAGLAECRCPLCSSVLTPAVYEAVVGALSLRDSEIESAAEARLADREAVIHREASAASAARIDKAERERKAAQQENKVLKATHRAEMQRLLEAQRDALNKDKAKEIAELKAGQFKREQFWEQRLKDMTREMENKTAHELGEPAEIDLFEQLTAAFPEDRISRVAKGVRGADVLVEVMDRDREAGKIVIDSKNHKNWKGDFTVKLRADQIAAKADWAILSTAKFPSGTRQLVIRDKVIVADPARVVALVHILREQIISSFIQKLSTNARNEKADLLYDFLLSPRCDDMLDELLRRTREIEMIDHEEAKAHKTVWSKRALSLQRIVAVHMDFTGVVADIIGGGR